MKKYFPASSINLEDTIQSKEMLLILIVLIALGETDRFIQHIKNAEEAKNTYPDLLMDLNLERSVADKLLNAEDIPQFNANEYTFPATAIDPQQRVFIDILHPERKRGDWFASVSGWYVEFNTTFTVTKGVNVVPRAQSYHH